MTQPVAKSQSAKRQAQEQTDVETDADAEAEADVDVEGSAGNYAQDEEGECCELSKEIIQELASRSRLCRCRFTIGRL